MKNLQLWGSVWRTVKPFANAHRTSVTESQKLFFDE